MAYSRVRWNAPVVANLRSEPRRHFQRYRTRSEREVSRPLHVALRNGRPPHQPDVRAYNLVLEGNYFKARRTLGDAERAAELYQQALEITPDYPLAWARLASAYLREEVMKGPPSEDQNRRVLEALNRAMQLDPNLAWAYYTRAGFEMSVTWDWAAAQADTKRMGAIDPQFELLPSAFGDIALAFGEVARAVEWYQNDIERNLLDPNALDSLGVALCAANRLEQCLQIRLRLQQLHPEFDGINSAVGKTRLYLGQFAAALEAMQREPNEDYRLGGLAMVYWANMKSVAESDAALNSLQEKFASSDPYGIAQVHAYRAESDAAFRWLNLAYQEHHAGMLDLKADPLLRNLHGDLRFRALLKRMQLTSERASGRRSRRNVRFRRHHLFRCFDLINWRIRHGIEETWPFETAARQTDNSERGPRAFGECSRRDRQAPEGRPEGNHHPVGNGDGVGGSRRAPEADPGFSKKAPSVAIRHFRTLRGGHASGS